MFENGNNPLKIIKARAITEERNNQDILQMCEMIEHNEKELENLRRNQDEIEKRLSAYRDSVGELTNCSCKDPSQNGRTMYHGWKCEKCNGTGFYLKPTRVSMQKDQIFYTIDTALKGSIDKTAIAKIKIDSDGKYIIEKITLK